MRANIPVQLPPFMVYGSRPRESHWKWGYVSFPGYEVLSGCGEWTTTLFARKVATQISILREIAPALFEAQASVPTSLILMNQDQALAISDDMRTVMEEGPAGPNACPPWKLLAPRVLSPASPPRLRIDGHQPGARFRVAGRRDPRTGLRPISDDEQSSPVSRVVCRGHDRAIPKGCV